jgi:DNA mismatch repair ATPase MutS
MTTFRELIKETPPLRFVLENMQIQSAIGEKSLLSSHFMTNPKEIEAELNRVANVKDWFFKNDKNRLICDQIHEIRDFSGTLKRLKGGETLDDIDLFEIKRGAFTIQKIAQLLIESEFTLFQLQDIKPIIDILDPENTQIPHFYIYSVYDSRLVENRKRLEKLEKSEEKDQLFIETTLIEDQVRERLTQTLKEHSKTLESNLHQIALLDVWIAKARLADLWDCCKPRVSSSQTSYKNLFHPITKSRLASENKKFQPINIDLFQTPTLITGANMSGKTIFLKTIAFAQNMFQCGFFVPARDAEICPVDEIYFSMGDQSSELTGLSSFAYEILGINEIIKEVKKGRKLMILVDELARTTNPVEGTILVNAFIEMMSQFANFCIVTTHYSGVKAKCRRLRVKGLQINEIKEKMDPKNIHQYMDYTLIEILNEEVPMEALKIAQLLGVDEEFLKYELF